MVKSTSVGYLFFVCTIFLIAYDAKYVSQTLGTEQQVTQTNRSVQDDKIVVESSNENLQDLFVPDESEGGFFVPNFQTVFDISNRSKGVEITDKMMQEYLASMIVCQKDQQKIRTADGLKMFEAFSEAKIPDTVVGVYERNQNGRCYRHVCSGAIMNYFHVITAASCVWNESTSQVKDPSTFLVIAGRTVYPGEINEANLEPGEQRFNASHLLVPKTFTGTAGNLQSDLAVIRLATVAKLTNNVEFIRVDWANEFVDEPRKDVQEGFFVDSENTIEDVIQYVNVSSCVEPVDKVKVTSADKRCSRSTGPTVSPVTFGAPFVVYHPDTRKHYLRGVLSWTYSDHGTRVVEFTDISNDTTLMWIKEAATGLFDPPANYKEVASGFFSWNKQNKTWQEAKALCEADGKYSYLVFPTKETEYVVMDNMFLSYMDGPMRAAWVGLSDRDKEGDIVSLFGMNVNSYEYVHWLDIANVTKNEEDEDCVLLTNIDEELRPGLMTSSCEERWPFICGFCLECALLDSAFGETQGVSRYLARSSVV